jgi:Arc/MetJ-type ribon-helix-helix transcriptional regulator
MQTMNISLPDQLKEFVDNQVGSGRYEMTRQDWVDIRREALKLVEVRKSRKTTSWAVRSNARPLDALSFSSGFDAPKTPVLTLRIDFSERWI